MKFYGEFILKKNEKDERVSFKNEDCEKLRPETDLNDTIMDNYLKVMHIALLPE